MDREKKIYRVTIVGALCNTLLLILKFVAGFVGNSAAMIADAIHSLSDFITDVVVVIFVKISNRPHDKDHPFGHGKYETLATIIIGLFLLGVGIKILVDGAVDTVNFFNGEKIQSPGFIALIAAIVSIVVKELLYRYTAKVAKEENSSVVKANAWHHRSDALSSIGVAVGVGAAVVLGDSWAVLDPIAAIVVSAFIIKSAVELIIPCVDELMERSLPEDVEKEVLETIMKHPEVQEPHNLRTRKIGNYCAVNVHVRMDGNLTLTQAHEVATNIEKELKLLLGGGSYINIHMEPIK